jgi:hypothetical protein
MALVKYAGLRIALFVAVAALLYAVGVRSLFVNAIIAILISGVASLFLLDRVRNEAGASLEHKVGRNPIQRLNDRMDAAARAEDEADDAARAARAAREAGEAPEATEVPAEPEPPGLRSSERPEGDAEDRTSN